MRFLPVLPYHVLRGDEQSMNPTERHGEERAWVRAASGEETNCVRKMNRWAERNPGTSRLVSLIFTLLIIISVVNFVTDCFELMGGETAESRLEYGLVRLRPDGSK